MFRKSICGAAIAACLAAPVWADDLSKLDVPVTEFDLPNGLHVILNEDHTIPTISTNLWYLVGSADESVGHTGFAHLFEHLMFCGSGHVAKGAFDELLENVGGTNNASTSEDRTNYYITVPSNALSLALFLESDRMGYLVQSLRENIVDEQRDVVKNELRQRYYTTPYGQTYVKLPAYMYPEGHPYSWPVIGCDADLDKFNHLDVLKFYKKYYVPNNACLAISGDFKTAEAKKLVEYWFSDIPRGEEVTRVTAKPVQLDGVIKKELRDKVELPLRQVCWHTPEEFNIDDLTLDLCAMILTDGTTSRLYQRLVYKDEIAQDVAAMEMSQRLGSIFMISFMPKPGHTLDEIQAVVDEELERLANNPPTQAEMDCALNRLEADFYRTVEKNSNKANLLNRFYVAKGNPNYFAEGLRTYRSITPQQVSDVVKRYLGKDRRLELTTLPEEKAKKEA